MKEERSEQGQTNNKAKQHMYDRLNQTLFSVSIIHVHVPYTNSMILFHRPLAGSCAPDITHTCL